ncbi:dna polymerase [Plasmopara halstedii]|uniref:DNA polymerase kappa n=1 Tax=Plasmopara halstedii TaxID=4781 RepID=A0A0P1AU94_PLAHL|nr:dna polymerase [Plasmopara halstedii]CEG44681.1 dna polymerase [Plasmopara halstedii]|eukprot:XP_024581050.1 dna polymerase [Plasmopara halstedii]
MLEPSTKTTKFNRHHTEATAMYVFTAEKAGMKSVDKQHVQEVVHKMSKDSKFYQKSVRDSAKVEQRVAAMREKLSCLSDGHLLRLQNEADAQVARLETMRDLSRTIVVVDMDMFYAAVEMRDDPTLRNVPLAVGGLGMISTANYAARQFGVRAAMPGFIGKELCPKLQFVPVNMAKYAGVAAQIRTVFAAYDPDFEAHSLDEACLDITNYIATNWEKYVSVALGDKEGKDGEWASTVEGRAAIAAAVVQELRQKIFDLTQLTASAGIAANAMLAKICSDLNKPNGQYVLPFTHRDVMGFVRELSVRKIGGIGKVMEKILNEALDIHTGADLFSQRAKLLYLFSVKTSLWLLQISLGIQERLGKQERKSFSRERTFKSLSDPTQLEAKCLEICQMLANDLEKVNMGARTVTFVYKDTKFARCSRSVSLASAVFSADDLFSNAVELLRRELPLTLRLMGVRAAVLVSRSKSASPSAVQILPSNKRQVTINKFAKRLSDPVTAELCGVLQRKSGCLALCNKRDMTMHRDRPPAHFEYDTIQEKRDVLEMSSNSHLMRKKLKKTVSDSLYAKKLSGVDIKPCPICKKPLNTLNNAEVNAHIDACIGLKKSSSLASNAAIKKKTNIIATPSAFTPTHTLSHSAEQNMRPCPICGKFLNVCNNMEVNSHMDACVIREGKHLRNDVLKKTRK